MPIKFGSGGWCTQNTILTLSNYSSIGLENKQSSETTGDQNGDNEYPMKNKIHIATQIPWYWYVKLNST